MKKLILSLVLAVIASTTSLLPTTTSAQGTVTWFTPGAWSGPTFGLMSTADINAVAYALMQHSSTVNGVAFITNGATAPASVALSISDEGRVIYYPFAVTSSVPFTLSQISYNLSWKNGTATYTGTLGGDHVSFTWFGVGIGTNGQTYTSGNANTPIVAAYCIGYGYNYDYTGFSMNQAQSMVNSQLPDRLATDYTLFGVSSGSLVNQIVPVPEPSQFFLTGAGISALIILFKKKK